MHSLAIVGSGAAGTMALLRATLNNDDCIVFPGTPKDRKRSRAMWVRKIENMPAHFGYAKGIDDPMHEVLRWIEASPFAAKLDFRKHTGVARIEKNDAHFAIVDSKGEAHAAKYVLLCTGVMDVQPLIGGSIAPVLPFANLQSIDYCLRCDGHHVLNKPTAVIGHTVAAAWVAIMLHERYSPPAMCILTHGEAPQFDAELRELLALYEIQVESAVIASVDGDAKKGELTGFTFADGRRIPAQMSFVALGMLVYSELAKGLGAELDARGFVKADAQGQSTVPGLYVAGDVMAATKKQVYTAWDTAVNAVDAINQKLRAEKRALKLAQFRASRPEA